VKKQPFRDRAREKVSSAGEYRLKFERVESGHIKCYQRTTWEIDTATSGGNTRCRLLIEGQGYDLPLAEQDGPTAGALYWVEEELWLLPGEKLVLLVDQAQADCYAEMYGIGYWTETKEGIVT